MLEENRSGALLCVAEVVLCCILVRGRSANLRLLFSSEDQDELHYQDTDSDVPEQRDGRCKVKWTQEEVSRNLVLGKSRCFGIGL